MKKTSSHFRGCVTSVFHKLKQNEPTRVSPVSPIYQKDMVVGLLRVISQKSLKNSSEIKYLASWRKKNNKWFPSQFRVTLSGTKRWAGGQLLNKEDRILFMIEDLNMNPIGHVGLYRFDFETQSCEIDNVIRGRAGVPGVMTAAIETLCAWGKDVLDIHTYYLRVVAHNAKAVALYKRCSFVEVERIPLKKIISDTSVVVWKELAVGQKGTPGKFDLKMRKK